MKNKHKKLIDPAQEKRHRDDNARIRYFDKMKEQFPEATWMDWSTTFVKLWCWLVRNNEVPVIPPPTLVIDRKHRPAIDIDDKQELFLNGSMFQSVRPDDTSISAAQTFNQLTIYEQNFIRMVHVNWDNRLPPISVAVAMKELLLHELGHYLSQYNRWKTFVTSSDKDAAYAVYTDWLFNDHEDVVAAEEEWCDSFAVRILKTEVSRTIDDDLLPRFGGPYERFLRTRSEEYENYALMVDWYDLDVKLKYHKTEDENEARDQMKCIKKILNDRFEANPKKCNMFLV